MLPWPASTRPKTISLQHSSQGPFSAFIMNAVLYTKIKLIQPIEAKVLGETLESLVLTLVHLLFAGKF